MATETNLGVRGARVAAGVDGVGCLGRGGVLVGAGVLPAGAFLRGALGGVWEAGVVALGLVDPDRGHIQIIIISLTITYLLQTPMWVSITLWELSLDPFNDFDVGAGNIMEEKPSLGVFDSSGMGADILMGTRVAVGSYFQCGCWGYND